MIVVRDIFRIKFGRMKEARATLAEGIPALKKEGYAVERLLADFVGPFYTLVMESSYRSLGDYEKAPEKMRASAKWGRSTKSSPSSWTAAPTKFSPSYPELLAG